MFNERGFGYVLILADRNAVTLIPTFLLFQGKPQEIARSGNQLFIIEPTQALRR
jgi:hypothetical protein